MVTRALADRIASIHELMVREKVPGLSVAVVADGDITWSRGFGVRISGRDEEITRDTVFEAASLSKQVFAFAVLRLVDAGVIELDRPLRDYLGQDYEEDPRIARITARHVLSHMTGFPNWRGDQQLRTHFTPGNRFSYSGEGFQYLQHVVSQLIDLPVHDYMRREILEPAGMRSASFLWTGDEEASVASPHEQDGAPVTKRLVQEMKAAATLHCSADDYARFLLLALGQAADHPLRLSAGLRAEMFRPQVAVNDSMFWQEDWPRGEIALHERIFWGLGWGLHRDGGETAVWQWGSNQFRSFVLGYPDHGTGAVLMANSCNGVRLWDDLICAIFDRPFEPVAWVAQSLGL